MGFILRGGTNAPISLILSSSGPLFLVGAFGTTPNPMLKFLSWLSSLYVKLIVAFGFCILSRAMGIFPYLVAQTFTKPAMNEWALVFEMLFLPTYPACL